MSTYPIVRKKARKALEILSEITGKTVKDMLEPLPKDLITETVRVLRMVAVIIAEC